MLSGYEQWAKVFNIKQAAKTVMFLQENDLTDYDKLSEQSAEASKTFHDLSAQIKVRDTRCRKIKELQKYIKQYRDTKDVFAEYKKQKYSKKYYEAHESDILLHRAAKNYFNENNITKLPSAQSLRQEYAQLDAERKKMYPEYKAAKEKWAKLATAKANTDRLLQPELPRKNKGMER